MSSKKLYLLSKVTRKKRKTEAFGKCFVKVKLVLINIRFRLNISMPIMVTNPRYRVWGMTHSPFLLPQSKQALSDENNSKVRSSGSESKN